MTPTRALKLCKVISSKISTSDDFACTLYKVSKLPDITRCPHLFLSLDANKTEKK